MKRIIPLVFLALSILPSAAQDYMLVHKTDGSTVQFTTEEVQQVDFKTEVSLSVSPARLEVSAESGYVQFNITCSGSWSVTSDDLWLTPLIASGNGNGTAFVSIAANTGAERTGQLVVSSGSKTATVTVVQAGVPVSDLSIEMTGIVALSDGVMADYEMSDGVTGYFETVLDSKFASDPDEQFIAYLVTQTELYSTDYPFTFVSGLSPNSEYLFLALPVDANGNIGQLMRRIVRTPSDINQPQALISNVSHTTSTLSWTTTPANGCTSYYLLANSDSEPYFSGLPDVFVAKLISTYAQSGMEPQSEFSSWSMRVNPTDTNFEIITWGMNARGELAGVINTYYAPAPRQVKQQVGSPRQLVIPAQKVARNEMEHLLSKVKVTMVRQ